MDSICRKTIRINFGEVPPKLNEIVLRVPEISSFNKRYGHLLSLVTTGFDEGLMSVLFQFFDPKQHCFTFPDYQLVPKLEELSKILGSPILKKVTFTGLEQDPVVESVAIALNLKQSNIESNWERRSGVKGLLASFLMKKAQIFLDAMSYHAFEDVLALLIYGLVLFPNSDQFIDISSINIFLARNPVPTLLGDVLHSLHTRTMKKRGTLMCCTPLLYWWFISHLPRSVLKNELGLRWN